MKYNIIVTPGGGCGTTHLIRTLPEMHRRVDALLDPFLRPWLSLDNEMTLAEVTEATERTKREYTFTLNSIKNNFNTYFQWIRKHNKLCHITYRLPMLDTKNEIDFSNALFFIRHPLHAYVSYLGKRHPERIEKIGGLNSKEGVEYYARIWNAVASRALAYKGNDTTLILGYEYANRNYNLDLLDLLDSPLKEVFQDWDCTRRNNGVLATEKDGNAWLEKYLMQLTWDNYTRIYGEDWEI